MVTVVGRFEREKANLDVFAGVEYPVVVGIVDRSNASNILFIWW